MAIQFVVPSSSIAVRENMKAHRRDASGGKRTSSHVCVSRPLRRGQRCGAPHSGADPNEEVVRLLPLVRRVAIQFQVRLPAYLELDDLVSDGTVGLIDAVRKFDPAKGVSIESYARYRIRGAILDSLREQDRASRDTRRRIKKIESTSQDLERRLGRPAGDPEMAEAMGLSLEQWYHRIADLGRLGFEGSVSRIPMETVRRVNEDELPAPSDCSPFVFCYHGEQRELLSRALRCLTERERSVIKLYYRESSTMKQIGRLLGVDESRVSQIHSGAMAKLRGRIADMLRCPPRARRGSTCALR